MMTNQPATYARHRYRANREAGICTQCGKAPAAEGRRCCEPCRQVTNATNQRRQARLRRLAVCLGICTQCLQRIRMQDRKWCGVCAEAHTERQLAKRTARREAGVCARCGGAKPCEHCRKVQRERNQRYRARLKARGMRRVA